jgi:mRNA-degrading endonuclease RelE of RelBE toxin-antitoxin system
MNQYTLHIPEDVERQLRQCRVSIRESIQKRLQEITEDATARPASRRKAAAATGPPLRFYVYEGFRVSYQVNPLTRSVVVLKLRTESS